MKNSMKALAFMCELAIAFLTAQATHTLSELLGLLSFKDYNIWHSALIGTMAGLSFFLVFHSMTKE